MQKYDVHRFKISVPLKERVFYNLRGSIYEGRRQLLNLHFRPETLF